MSTAPAGVEATPKRAERSGTLLLDRKGPDRSRILLWLAVVLIIIFCLFPFYWLIVGSLEPVR